ncbi:hypothetical protein N9P99_01785 [Planktomarina temperata]|nr:hypothetical protein [Planktomarina temperata]
MRITLVAFIWLITSAVTPAFGGVGDVYYCILDRGYEYNKAKKAMAEVTFPKFTFTQKTENLIKFSEDFFGIPLAEYQIQSGTGADFAPIEILVSVGMFTNSNNFLFDGKNFKYTIFQNSELSDYIAFFTCSKF